MIVSMRKNGMREPVIVGARRMTASKRKVFEQLGDVKVFSLEDATYSLPCYKPLMMLQARTPYVTWVDADGFFRGNCSERLKPVLADQIHVRVRGPEEEAVAFRGFASSSEDPAHIPALILNAWRDDVNGLSRPLITRSCLSCLISVHATSREFLRKWHNQTMDMLPPGDVDGSDPVLKYYHLLSESVFNSMLAFWSKAPRVSPSYALDKDPNACYIHFPARPKPWRGWPSESIAHFSEYVALVEWARKQGFRLPGKVPFALKRRNRILCSILQIPVACVARIVRLFWR